MKKCFFKLLLHQDGQGLTEYSLIISLVILAVIGALEFFGDGVFSLFEDISNVVLTDI